jgi:hypothetical protein
MPSTCPKAIIPRISSNVLHPSEAYHFEYFRDICAPEFALYFELHSWSNFVLQAAYREPSMWHAALAISALSRRHYVPNKSGYEDKLLYEYGVKQYNYAIQNLNRRLDCSTQSLELAILASIVFITIEVLQGHNDKVQIHLRCAFAILKTQPKAITKFAMNENFGSISLVTDAPPYTLQSPSDLNYLVEALIRVNEQVLSFSALRG